MEWYSEPRTAKRRRRSARRERGKGGGPCVSGRGSVRRLLWRTRPKSARARHEAIESWKLEADRTYTRYRFLFRLDDFILLYAYYFRAAMRF